MNRILLHIEEILVVVLLTFMCVIVALQVFFRLILQDPLIWTEELATIFFVWVVFIGASLALKRNEHFAVELLQRSLPLKDRQLVNILVGVLLIVFSLLVLIEGARITWLNVQVNTAAMEISRAWAYSALPVGGLLMLVRSIEILLRHIKGDIPNDLNSTEILEDSGNEGFQDKSGDPL